MKIESLANARDNRGKKKDVKNEGRTDYVLENTGSIDKLS